MDFLQQLGQVSYEASEQRRAEQELAAAVIEKFQHECLLAAQEGETELTKVFLSKNWNKKPDCQQEFASFLHQKLQAIVGQNSQASVSRDSLGRFRGIELSASWPRRRPEGTAAQHSSSHVPRSNLMSQCPVCLRQAEVVALTP
ncbi:unnamed protein product [Polarella glacialis]|uniref:Uncharacterized protein n=1 Tax=Polarella glacialis TaxID=89957 RepID=A0A813G899_POLGL|nr:unnamed protein product [Polarella glacialis]